MREVVEVRQADPRDDHLDFGSAVFAVSHSTSSHWRGVRAAKSACPPSDGAGTRRRPSLKRKAWPMPVPAASRAALPDRLGRRPAPRAVPPAAAPTRSARSRRDRSAGARCPVELERDGAAVHLPRHVRHPRRVIHHRSGDAEAGAVDRQRRTAGLAVQELADHRHEAVISSVGTSARPPERDEGARLKRPRRVLVPPTSPASSIARIVIEARYHAVSERSERSERARCARALPGASRRSPPLPGEVGLVRPAGKSGVARSCDFADLAVIRQTASALSEGRFRAIVRQLEAERSGQLALDFRHETRPADPHADAAGQPAGRARQSRRRAMCRRPRYCFTRPRRSTPATKPRARVLPISTGRRSSPIPAWSRHSSISATCTTPMGGCPRRWRSTSATNLAPDFFEGHYNLANVLHDAGRLAGQPEA